MSLLTYREIIQGLINGTLKSPQIYEESFYIKLRITGTGITERYKEDKNGDILLDDKGKPITYKINRLEDEFLSEKFLKACIGIPVLIEHPEEKLLNGENYKNHVVGTIVETYINAQIKEVWAIARIYDPEVLKLINEKLKSTSPAVKTKEIKNNGSGIINGKDTIVEERFEYIDHLALVVDGYWDNYSEKAIQIDNNKRIIPNSNENINNEIKEDNMPEELLEENKKEEIKKDEDIGENIENEETQKIASIEDKLNQLISILSKKDESVKNDGEEDAQFAVEHKQGATLDDIASKLDMLISQFAEKDEKAEQTDMNEEVSPNEAVSDSDEEETIEEEEEKKVVVDKAYNLASKYKEDGVKFIKEREFDTKISYISRFLNANKNLIAEKYKHLLKGKIDKDNYALAIDAMKSIGDCLETKEKEKIKQAKDKPVCVYHDGKVKRYENVF